MHNIASDIGNTIPVHGFSLKIIGVNSEARGPEVSY